MQIIKAQKEDLERILEIQKQAFQPIAEECGDCGIPPLTQTYDEIVKEFGEKTFLKAIIDDKTVGSVRAYSDDDTCYIARLIVDPQYQNRGIGKRLMKEIEAEFKIAKRYELFTGKQTIKNIEFYEKLGYIIYRSKMHGCTEIVYMEKLNG